LTTLSTNKASEAATGVDAGPTKVFAAATPNASSARLDIINGKPALCPQK